MSAPAALAGNVHQGPSIAVIEAIAPSEMRSEACALIRAIGSIVAGGVGPILYRQASRALAPAREFHAEET